MTVCMEYLARTSKGSEPDNAAGRGQEAHAGRTANLPGCYSFVGVGFCPHLNSRNASPRERYNYMVLVILTNTT